MPCYKPLEAFQYLTPKPNGKAEIIFKRPIDRPYKEIELPCGQCIGCRILRTISWAMRIQHEIDVPAKDKDGNNIVEQYKNCFITLTYDDKHLPQDHSLYHEHFQKFLKRFRKAIYPKKIRFFMCGEYGDDTWRPHYHAIIFGYDFTEGIKYKGNWHNRRQRIQESEVGNPYYISSFLKELWGMSKNYPIIAEANFDTAAYVARYCTKKITGEKADEHYNRQIIDWNEYTGEVLEMFETQLLPEYSSSSKKPGIGKGWWEKYKTDTYSNYLINNGKKTPVPKYYDKLLEMEDEVQLKAMKVARQLALINKKEELTPERLKQRHEVKKKQMKQLERKKI